MKTRLTVISLICAASALMPAAARPWEEASRRDAPQSEIQIDSEQIDITVKDGWVYITTQKTVQVKIFNILGQIISSETIQPGTHRFHLSARGIYILKAGGITRRITI